MRRNPYGLFHVVQDTATWILRAQLTDVPPQGNEVRTYLPDVPPQTGGVVPLTTEVHRVGWGSVGPSCPDR